MLTFTSVFFEGQISEVLLKKNSFLRKGKFRNSRKMEKHILSKSSFLKGCQCPKALYMSKHNRALWEEPDAALQAIFTQGKKVGMLAQQLFPGGIDCTPESNFDFQEAVMRTSEEIAKGTKVIYEAAFQFDGVLAALDILVRNGNEWMAYEVKSSTSVTETYEWDATIQYYTITNSGIALQDISIVHVNNQYVKDGPVDVHELFTIASVKERVLELLPGIPAKVAELKAVLSVDKIPEMDIGPHCNNPYSCDFAGHCWEHIPDYSVFNIARLTENRKFELYKKNIINFIDIPDDYPLNENQWMQVKSELNNTTTIDKQKIKEFVSELQYPLYFMDFETFATAIPVFDKSKPYQQLLFQYSLHILPAAKGELQHKEFLAEANGTDPRIPFIEKLITDCGTTGDILVYNIGFERGKLLDLAMSFPKYKIGINNIIARLKDLMIPFQQRWYYTPSMQGSYSIKKVLPALVPEMSYKDLNIQEGGSASNVFASMVMGEFEGDVEQVRGDLREYCGMDTLGMVEVLKKLRLG